MSTPNIAARFVALALIVSGLSHILRPREWAGLFIDLLKKPCAGLLIGLPTFMVGLPIVLAHQIWVPRPAVIVTIFGWGWTTKGLLYLLWPHLFQRVATRHLEHPERFRWAGLVLVLLGGAVAIDQAVNVR